MKINKKLRRMFRGILQSHKNDKNPPEYVKTIKELLELENSRNEG